ncbi:MULTISPECIES: bifunctional 2-polyprenyl-6-hydroxyphenol methylase/3-demethylubiquinol 3-O-methyltransferase UbiG [Actinosynnema]|uniref:class I SAM-dependent methyltransferase n=1 Tax=Actinosynnema TaxID=40566 RepID=UPI0020A46FE1|nr:class I SAM-dependent methyltransferase [Actinosynnema pretiosum]MCP2092295.1 Methyltransferase domain-containing protein [Actinosynnema pretiosum]
MGKPTRWATDTKPGHSQWYIERFRTMRRDGADLAGEARTLDAMLRRGSRVLDAGCGTGRVSAELHARGHVVVGVDADPALIEAAREDHPEVPVLLAADLADLDLAGQGVTEPFDAIVCAGNVMTFLAPGSEVDVLRGFAEHLVPDGFAVVGFGTDRGYPLADFDEHCAAAGLVLEQRFATWDLRPWDESAGFAVTVLRKP